jgi:hypothetical protein
MKKLWLGFGISILLADCPLPGSRRTNGDIPSLPVHNQWATVDVSIMPL